MGSSDSFICTKCNKCCENSYNLALFEWEVERLKKMDNNADIRPAIIGKIGETEVVLQWGMKDIGKGHCRFLRKDGCSIYKDRPLVCQAFPLTKSGLLKNDQEKIIDKECPEIIIPFETVQQLKKEEYRKRMESVYNETFKSAIRLDAARSWISDLYQFTARKIKTNKKVATKERIGLLEFVKRERLMTDKEIEYEINQLNTLK